MVRFAGGSFFYFYIKFFIFFKNLLIIYVLFIGNYFVSYLDISIIL